MRQKTCPSEKAHTTIVVPIEESAGVFVFSERIASFAASTASFMSASDTGSSHFSGKILCGRDGKTAGKLSAIITAHAIGQKIYIWYRERDRILIDLPHQTNF